MALLTLVGAAVAQLPTTKQNFYHPGTQPGGLIGGAALVSPSNCQACHADYNDEWAPFNRWAQSLHGQSGRDPVFHAAFAVAEQDAAFAGQFCYRCHLPQAWLSNRVKFNTDTDSAAYGKVLPLAQSELLGVSCSVCHRMVDPVYQPGASPSADQAILSALSNDTLFPAVPGYPTVVLNPHNAAMVIDTQDRRRGPFDLDADWGGAFPYHQYLQSAFHLSSRMCATCHDVSTPHFTKQPDGSFGLNPMDAVPHPDKHMQFPEQRTFSEWANSLFAQAPVNLGGRFGGASLTYSSCQDCHMQKVTGQGCALDPPTRPDLPQHNFSGANSWVLRAVNSLFPSNETGLLPGDVDNAIARNVAMLGAASDLELTAGRGSLNVRIINYTGHKLPTGYTEGRRMWVNVVFRDAQGSVIAERGAYDPATAVLSEANTKVYESKLGPDATLAAQTNQTAGPAFRLVLSNKVYKDNRIPPMGFTNANFAAVGAPPVPAGLYVDGQYWDDTLYASPIGARSAEVKVYHQTTTKEYIEFLRDAVPGDTRGTVAYDQWVLHGKSAPVLMDTATVPLACRCDWNADMLYTVADIFAFLSDWFAQRGDFDQGGTTNVSDIFQFLSCWFARCAGY